MEWPSTSGLAEKRSLHMRLLMIATGVSRGRSSSAENSRPSSSSTPRVLKNPEEICLPLKCSGGPGDGDQRLGPRTRPFAGKIERCAANRGSWDRKPRRVENGDCSPTLGPDDPAGGRAAERARHLARR